jgi:hypothetical protein
VETLLHEMIHAFLFVTENNRDRDGHGPEFHKHMYRINAATGASISVYHTFHDEVALYKQHWWRCDGPCVRRPPFYGFVKRAMNRAPGPADRWWAQHGQACGGAFVKVKEPEGKAKAGKGKVEKAGQKGQKDIRDLLKGKENVSGKKGKGAKEVVRKPGTSAAGPSVEGGGTSVAGGGTRVAGGGPGAQGGGGRGPIFGFGGTSFGGTGGGGGLRTAGKTGTVVVRPGQRTPADNSSGGAVVGPVGAGTTAGPQGAGHRLGSSSSAGQEGASVQETLRRRWGEGGSAATKPGDNKTKPGGSKTKPNGTKPDTKAKPGVGQTGSEMQTCPVCARPFPAAEINGHLDSCLAEAGGHQGDGLDDGDDAALLAAAIDLEESMTEETPPGASAISISDSVDDEPLVKRPCDKIINDARNILDETTTQDDLDMLAALEDTKEDQDCSMFACPVCDSLLSHTAMNQHLDTCLV